MATQLIEEERICDLNDRDANDGGDYVLYWMQQSQRAEWNHALEYAVREANRLEKPLLVGFGLFADYPDANLRHFRFLLEGLADVRQSLSRRGIPFVLRFGSPESVAIDLAQDAAIVVCDRGYLRHQKQWRDEVSKAAKCRVTQVEADVVVPVETASDDREYAARTIRPKLQSHHEKFLVELRTTSLETDSSSISVSGEDVGKIDHLLDKLKLDGSVASVEQWFQGGTGEARRIFDRFVQQKMNGYDEHRNQPETTSVSHMSKYLHFGQISPVYLAMKIRDSSAGSSTDRESFLEELLIRRELAQNFVHFTKDYDSYSCLPEWAQETLQDHKDDDREHHYTAEELENGETHDPYWNAAMKEMRETGYMHNYMRMYWGKKILEWTNTPEYAFQVTLKLNNKYFVDGRDPNSFANVAWVFGNHDRAFTERKIFGKVRYMSEGGLKRKADADGYVEKVDQRVSDE